MHEAQRLTSLIIVISQHTDRIVQDLKLINALCSCPHPKGHTQSTFIQCDSLA